MRHQLTELIVYLLKRSASDWLGKFVSYIHGLSLDFSVGFHGNGLQSFYIVWYYTAEPG